MLCPMSDARGFLQSIPTCGAESPLRGIAGLLEACSGATEIGEFPQADRLKRAGLDRGPERRRLPLHWN